MITSVQGRLHKMWKINGVAMTKKGKILKQPILKSREYNIKKNRIKITKIRPKFFTYWIGQFTDNWHWPMWLICELQSLNDW